MISTQDGDACSNAKCEESPLHGLVVFAEDKGKERKGLEVEQIPEKDPIDITVAERHSINAAKLAAANAFEEVGELILEVRNLRLQGKLRDAAKSAQSLAVTAGILTDKALLLEGRPTQITETRDAEDILQSLNSLVPGLVIDSTAEEI